MRTTRKIYLAVMLVLVSVVPVLAVESPTAWQSSYPGTDPYTVGLYHLDQTMADIPTIGDAVPAAVGVDGFRGWGPPWNARPGGYTGNWGPVWGTGYFDKGLEHHGQDTSWPAYNYAVTIPPDASQDTLSMTVEAWIKPDSQLGASHQRLFEKWWQYTPDGLRYRLGYRGTADGRLEANINVVDTDGVFTQKNINTAAVITPGVWQHVALTIDDATKTAKVWVNGFEEGSVDFTGYSLNIPPTPGAQGGPDNFVGGSPWDGASYFYQGSMDEIRFSSVAREFVPEPATIALLGIGGLLLRRRRHA